MKRLSVMSTLVATVAMGVMSSPSHAGDKGRVPKLQESVPDKYRQDKPVENPYASSATISSFSSSQIDSNGRTSSQSKVTGNAMGNASVFGQANGNASSTIKRYGRDQNSNASSSARLRIGGESNPYRSPYNEAASSVSVTKNGVQISRSAEADDQGTVTKLDVITRSEEIALRQNSDGPIEVRIQSRNKNADAKVYSANNRDELKKKYPALVRRIEAYEKIVGTAQATVDAAGGGAAAKTNDPIQAAPIGNNAIDAKQMLQAQLEKMLQENGANPNVQELLRKQLQELQRN